MARYILYTVIAVALLAQAFLALASPQTVSYTAAPLSVIRLFIFLTFQPTANYRYL